MVKILEIFSELLGDELGNVPCYNTVENWVKKLGLSVYKEDRQPCQGSDYAMVIDESIMINREKLLLILGIPADHQGRAVRHEDVTVVGMSVSQNFTGDYVKEKIIEASKDAGYEPSYIISDMGHNLTKGIAASDNIHHADISHAMGVILKHAYSKQPDFMELTKLLGSIRLQYHLTDKAYLLPPNMRAIARFMNMSSWVEWGNNMLDNFHCLPQDMQKAYSFVTEHEALLRELGIAIDAVKYVESICKNEGFCFDSSAKCKRYVIRNVIGNTHSRQARLGLKMIEYFQKEEALLTKDMRINISSDIIESDFGIYKTKKSPNKLYGITPFVLFIPLYPKIVNESVTKTFNFKERLLNVKMKDVSAWSKEHMSKNWVTERIKTLKKAS